MSFSFLPVYHARREAIGLKRELLAVRLDHAGGDGR